MNKEWMDELGAKLSEMDRLMDQTVAGLRRMTELQRELCNQYGEHGLDQLRDAIDGAVNGWMASNC